jgi:hypothetical protein
MARGRSDRSRTRSQSRFRVTRLNDSRSDQVRDPPRLQILLAVAWHNSVGGLDSSGQVDQGGNRVGRIDPAPLRTALHRGLRGATASGKVCRVSPSHLRLANSTFGLDVVRPSKPPVDGSRLLVGLAHQAVDRCTALVSAAGGANIGGVRLGGRAHLQERWTGIDEKAARSRVAWLDSSSAATRGGAHVAEA